MGMAMMFRTFFGLIMGGCLAWSVWMQTDPELSAEEPEGKQPRYRPIISGLLLPLYLALLVGIVTIFYSPERAIDLLFSLCFTVFLQISLYYLFLSLAAPFLRRRFSARACGMLWLIPNYLYFAQHSWMSLPEPLWVLKTNRTFLNRLALIWFTGFAALLLWKCFSHLRFRRQLFKKSVPVYQPHVLTVWEENCKHANCRKVYPLYYSETLASPLSIGFWESTIRVVLPRRSYTDDELNLIFQHELCHIQYGDTMTKFFMVFCTAMCWFNPLMWLAMRKSAEDLELSCDESILRHADTETRNLYADLLLRAAGDERGFTTCLSASAQSLRYRLGRIVVPKKVWSGGLLTGLSLFLLVMTCGFTALAYDGGTGQDYIFQGDDPTSWPIFGISMPTDHGYTAARATDPDGLREYLGSLELYKLSGNYDNTDMPYFAVMLRSPDSLIPVIIRENTVKAVPHFGDKMTDYVYYCPDGIDFEYLYSMLERLE